MTRVYYVDDEFSSNLIADFLDAKDADKWAGERSQTVPRDRALLAVYENQSIVFCKGLGQ